MFEKIKWFLSSFSNKRDAIDNYDEKIKTYYKQEIADIFAGTPVPGKRPKPQLRV